MSRLKTSVGNWKFEWKTAPRGSQGTVFVDFESGDHVKGSLELKWKRDADGLWLLLPHGLFGFDLKRDFDDSDLKIYDVSQRSDSAEWVGILSSYEGGGSLSSAASGQGGREGKAKKSRVRAQMPGKIIRILVKKGQLLEKDQPMILMEAMKMENEIRASHEGLVSEIKVVEGQAVESGADLILMENSSV